MSLVLQNVIAMHAGKVLYSSCKGKHGAQYKTNFITLKAVLTFQTLMLATLGKRATTHDRVFILGKNCSWILLPGSTWLWMPITRLYQSSVQSYRTHFASLKRVDDLSRLYDGLSTTRQATRCFKIMLKILVERALMHHISFPSVRMAFASTLDRFTCHNNLCKKSVPRSRSIRNLFFNRYLSFWRK